MFLLRWSFILQFATLEQSDGKETKEMNKPQGPQGTRDNCET